MQQNMYGVMIITPPQLNRLRIKQQQFRQNKEQLVWNTIIEKEKDVTDDEAERDSSDSDDDDSVKDVPIVTPEKKSIMQRLIWCHLISYYQRHSG